MTWRISRTILMGPGDSPQARFFDTLIRFSKTADCRRARRRCGGRGRHDHAAAFRLCVSRGKRKVSDPFINLALAPEFASSFTLPRQIAYLQAAELILLGEPFNEARAKELGPVTAIVPDRNVWGKASEIAMSLARKPAEALGQVRKLLNASDREAMNQAVSRELSEFARQNPVRRSKRGIFGISREATAGL